MYGRKIKKIINWKIIITICLFSLGKGGEASVVNNTEVVIIGAGLAGLTAGYYLTKDGIDVKIYEARNRIGGRVYTHYFDDGVFEECGGKEINDGGDAKRIKNLASKINCPIRSEFETYRVSAIDKNSHQHPDLFELSSKFNSSILGHLKNFSNLGERLDHYLGKEDDRGGPYNSDS